MYQKFNFVSGLLLELLKKVNETNSEGVIWIGLSPILPLVYQVLLKINIPLIAVMDNDPTKQGVIVIPYKKNFSNLCSFEKKIVSPVNIYPKKNILYLMANSHYTEIFHQLNSQDKNLSKENVINLFSFYIDSVNSYFLTKDKYIKKYRLLDIRQIQHIELELLIDFRNFCEENHLNYFLGGGSLIGAVRHNGFIPWDDDIDVYMPYEDYISFINKYDGKFKILDYRTCQDYPLQFAQLVDNSTFLFREMDWMNSASIMSVFIDIFPISGYENDKHKIEEQWEKNFNLDGEWWFYNSIKEVRDICSNDIRNEISNKRYQKSFYESEYVGNMIRTSHHPWAVKRSLFDKTKTVIFEGEKFKAPCGYNEYLTYRYGDYMQIPPENKREQHKFISGVY